MWVIELAMSDAIAAARLVEQIRRVRHALHAAGTTISALRARMRS